MIEDIVAHQLEEGVVAVTEERVSYFNEVAFRLFPTLKKGQSGGFLRSEFPDAKGMGVCGDVSYRYKKVTNGLKVYYIFSLDQEPQQKEGISEREMVGFCRLIEKETAEIFTQLETWGESTPQAKNIRLSTGRLLRMADMLYQNLDETYTEQKTSIDVVSVLEEVLEQSQKVLDAMELTVSVEKPPTPAVIYSKKSKIQRIMFLLLSVAGEKGETLTISFQQSVHQVLFLLSGSKETKLQGLEESYLKGLLKSIGGTLLQYQQNPFQIQLQFEVGRLPPQLQAGLQGSIVPLLSVEKKAVYLPKPEILLANRLEEEYFKEEKL